MALGLGLLTEINVCPACARPLEAEMDDVRGIVY
jgi:hypothetical protein